MRIPPRLSVLLAGLLALTLVFDLWMRRVPISRVAFRAWEAAEYSPTSLGPFRPNFHYFNPRVFGDLANLGDLPEYRVYRSETFTTDAFGFRNFSPGTRPADVVMAGDSFTGGAALSDNETVSVRLAHETDLRVYNAGSNIPWPVLQQVLSLQKLQGGTVVLEISETKITTNLELDPTVPLPARFLQWICPPELYRGITSLYTEIDSWLGYSPLRIQLTRAFLYLEKTGWLPVPESRQVAPVELANGHRMLFFAAHEQSVIPASQSDIDYFAHLRDRIRRTGNRLLVVMVPSKYRVYEPLMRGGRPIESAYIQLASSLRENGIACLDLTPILSAQAAALLATGRYNFHDDDTHWNADGAALAARAIAAVLNTTGAHVP